METARRGGRRAGKRFLGRLLGGGLGHRRRSTVQRGGEGTWGTQLQVAKRHCSSNTPQKQMISHSLNASWKELSTAEKIVDNKEILAEISAVEVDSFRVVGGNAGAREEQECVCVCVCVCVCNSVLHAMHFAYRKIMSEPFFYLTAM